MTRKSWIILSVLIVMMIAMAGCKSQRAIIKAPLKEEGADYLMARLNEKEFEFDSFEARANLSYRQNRKHLDFKAQVRIIKDSLIWVSFNQDLGIEVARVMITQDSVKFVDRINKQYLLTDYDFIDKFLNTNVDFGMLQSIILGNDFEYYEMAEFKASVEGGQYRLSTTGRSKLKKYVRNSSDAQRVLLQSIWLNPETFKITHVRLKELTRDSRKLEAAYSDFDALNGQLFPTKIKYAIDAAEPMEVTVEYSRIELNHQMSFPFKIPSKYEPAR
jgi:hypothetical protein